ncbi:MAG: ATP-binding cassette domain-containing protein [Planctomycetota bacterium]
MTAELAARVAGLVVRAGNARLLGPVSLELRAGEHLLLVGPSGSGKTTLLRALAGLAVPESGTIELFGRPASAPGRILVPPERRGIGMLFQGGALWPHLSVARTLAFVLRRAGVADVRGRVAELVARLRLDGLERRMPATLSGGEKQRLALARALAARPRLLLLDELLGPLDAELRVDLLATLVRLHREEGCTMVHVTHDPAEARRHAARTLRLAEGQIAGVEVDRDAAPAGGGTRP